MYNSRTHFTPAAIVLRWSISSIFLSINFYSVISMTYRAKIDLTHNQTHFQQTSCNACPLLFAQFLFLFPFSRIFFFTFFHPSSGHMKDEPPDQVFEGQEQSLQYNNHNQYYQIQQQQQHFLQNYQSPVSEDFDFNHFQSLERAKWYY